MPYWAPRWLLWLWLHRRQSSLLWGLVSLLLVAPLTSSNTVGPVVLSTSRLWNDVVYRKILPALLPLAVSTGVVVSDEERLSAKVQGLLVKLIVAC